MSDVSHPPAMNRCHLIPLYHLLSCSSAESCYSVFCLLAYQPFFPENSSTFFILRQAFYFRMAPFNSYELLVGRWYVQHAAIWHCYLLLYTYIIFIFCCCFCSFPFFFIPKKSSFDKSTELSTIPGCPNRMCLLNRGDTEGSNCSKILCLMFVHVCFVSYKSVSGLILQI